MVLNSIIFLSATILLGFILQSILPSSSRIIIYPTSFLLGILTGYGFYGMRYYYLSFALGMSSRAAIGGYWMCMILEIFLLLAGISVQLLF